MPTERLTGLDTAFLSLESNASPMHLGGLAIFRPANLGAAGHPGRVAALLVDRLQQLPQLRRRVQSAWFPPGAATWVEDPEFRVENHIHRHHLDGGGRDQAASLAAELLVRPLPRTRPLWDLHLMSGLGGGRFALLFRMHHAFGDGLSALEIGYGLLDGFSAKGAGTTRGSDADSPAVTGSSMLSQLLRLVRYVRDVPGDVRHAVGGAVGQVTGALGIAGAVLGSARLPSPGSPLLIESSDQRSLAVARLDLRQLHRVRRHYGGTVNDVMLSVVTGALREWLATRGDPVERLDLRAFVPVSQRARSGNRIGGNRLSGYLFRLPVGEPDPAERLRAIRGAMEQCKAAGPSRGAGAIPLLADRLPPLVHRLAAPMAGQGASLLFDLMVTSVPLPTVPLTLDGAELDEIFPLAPLAAGQALVIGLSWYRDSAYVSLLADREGLPDVQRLADAIQLSAVALDRQIA